MAKPKTVPNGADPYWKVRVSMPGSIIHLASRTEPKVLLRQTGRVASVEMDLIVGTDLGDTPGFIDWDPVIAVTWRMALPEPAPEPETHMQSALITRELRRGFRRRH